MARSVGRADSAAPDSRWGARDYILGALSTTHPIGERAIKTSIPEQYHKEIEPVLAGLVDAGFVVQRGKRFVKRD